jgi:HAAS
MHLPSSDRDAGGIPTIGARGIIMSDTAVLAHGDIIVLDYLAALWAESEHLSPDVRDELMATVADYIALRRADNEPHQVVGRLGPPEALAAAAHRGAISPHVRRRRSEIRRPLPTTLPSAC